MSKENNKNAVQKHECCVLRHQKVFDEMIMIKALAAASYHKQLPPPLTQQPIIVNMRATHFNHNHLLNAAIQLQRWSRRP